MKRVGTLLGAIVVLVLATLGSNAAGAPATGASCPGAKAALERGQLEAARDEYLDVLASEAGSECAERGLRETTTATRAEQRLCAEGKALADSGDAEEAQQRYVNALAENVNSECATEGLKPPPGKSLMDRVGEWSALLPKVLLGLFVGLGAIGLVVVSVKRFRNPSLVIKPFADGGVETKVGVAVAGLVEAELIDLSERGKGSGDRFQLDFVVANVELLARDENLSEAMGSLAETSQLQLAVALMSLVDRLFGRRSLVAEGELMPPGDQGNGVLLALFRRNALQAREAQWAPVPGDAAPASEDPPDPQPYYGLAPRAASWVQYEAARSLDSSVRLITESAESFALLVSGLALQRKASISRAELLYARALALDPDNVAALFNLAILRARYWGAFDEAIDLLIHAIDVLQDRYEEAR